VLLMGLAFSSLPPARMPGEPLGLRDGDNATKFSIRFRQRQPPASAQHGTDMVHPDPRRRARAGFKLSAGV